VPKHLPHHQDLFCFCSLLFLSFIFYRKKEHLSIGAILKNLPDRAAFQVIEGMEFLGGNDSILKLFEDLLFF